MIFNGTLFEDDIFNGVNISGTWTKQISFSFVAGATVLINTTASETKPLGSDIKYYAGESLSSLTELTKGDDTGVPISATEDGTVSIYVMVLFITTDSDYVPSLQSVKFTVKQSATLYTIATDVLNDAVEGTDATYEIDDELRNILVPYAWFNAVSHRYALKRIAEAAYGGVVFQNRYGVIVMQAGNYFDRLGLENKFAITQSQMYSADNDLNDIKNKVSILTRPWKAKSEQAVWTSVSTVSSGDHSYTVFYSDYEAVLEAHAGITSDPAGATIVSSTFYPWGATIKINASIDDQDVTLTVYGKPLAIVGAQTIERLDSASIQKNGTQQYTIEDNNMIQSADVADTIAEKMLVALKNERRDIVTEWRGNPCIELGDRGTIDDVEVAIVSNEFAFDGYLTCTTKGRRL